MVEASENILGVIESRKQLLEFFSQLRKDLLYRTTQVDLRSALETIINDFKQSRPQSSKYGAQAVLDMIAKESDFQKIYQDLTTAMRLDAQSVERQRKNLYNELSKHVHTAAYPIKLDTVLSAPEQCAMIAYLKWCSFFQYDETNRSWYI